MESINPGGLKRHLDQGEKLVLLDVREPWEYDLCRIEGSINIPMTELQDRLEELDRDGDIVVICHHGARSFHAASYLEITGFGRKIMNLEGGIDAWAAEVDGRLQRY